MSNPTRDEYVGAKTASSTAITIAMARIQDEVQAIKDHVAEGSVLTTEAQYWIIGLERAVQIASDVAVEHGIYTPQSNSFIESRKTNRPTDDGYGTNVPPAEGPTNPSPDTPEQQVWRMIRGR